ncbi:hypothetical protein G3005_001710 [Campylobacter jejuni]|nr:hypothetical protein [Campylobacter jejuni]EAK8716831.1 hypothetical protein [Campylobacter jejuni]EEA8544106.1 hypothetical protein [Campylobacter jejuni]
MLNILHANSSHRFHKCMPKEVHQIYDTLKLMEQQEGTKKSRSQKKKSKVILQIQIKQIIKK